jgi:hypothetical protein
MESTVVYERPVYNLLDGSGETVADSAIGT